MPEPTAPELPASVREGLAEMAGPEGWWQAETGDTFERLAADLLAHGYQPEEALDLLNAALAAVSEEYGE